ncbi:MAG: hypothetical protein JWN07_2859 [Hyphomicrobiales bacterium]|nr:hypothetical protein [Hyphomicrobiales bacterium]
MLTASISGLRAYGASATALVVIAVLAGILIQRRIVMPHMASEPPTSVAAAPVSLETALPDLRRIVLDPCTGLEKPRVQVQASKVD